MCGLAADGRSVPIGPLAVGSIPGGGPVAGWCVVTPREHSESFAELAPELAGAMMSVASRLARAQRDLLGARKGYLALFSEAVPHVHLHVIPRYDDTPAEWRGAAIFGRDLPKVSDAEQDAAFRRLAGAISAS